MKGVIVDTVAVAVNVVEVVMVEVWILRTEEQKDVASELRFSMLTKSSTMTHSFRPIPR